ncbi:ApeI family dehydratase [Shewanella marina]|uniref:ApeI family dehydratase n=1 Tax=Shewanella marina TaxID=487319 RepID=UPI0004713900|nr:thioester dehydrase [Shewanella marina]
MIKSCLPTILATNTSENSTTWTLFIDANSPSFNGHFQQQPILPGVTQLDWAVRLGCQTYGYPIEVAQLEVLKFQQLLLPNMEVQLTIEHQPHKGKMIFSYHQDEQRFASGRIVIKDAC